MCVYNNFIYAKIGSDVSLAAAIVSRAIVD